MTMNGIYECMLTVLTIALIIAGNDQMAPSFGLVPILVTAVVATAFVLGAIFAAICIIVAVSKRKSGNLSAPTYEEVSLPPTKTTIPLEENLAYGHIK